jgi:hypothetical protein
MMQIIAPASRRLSRRWVAIESASAGFFASPGMRKEKAAESAAFCFLQRVTRFEPQRL